VSDVEPRCCAWRTLRTSDIIVRSKAISPVVSRHSIQTASISLLARSMWTMIFGAACCACIVRHRTCCR
jgi:NADH:ubiquinone oxidoreductase subunit B-like Fe-S oxidoreductase